LRTDYYINPMKAVVPQASNQAINGATNLVHTWTDYCGNFIYENDTLKQTLIDGGYISYVYSQGATQPTPIYHFYVQDHLGNNRLVVDEKGTIEQVNHYYPYGGLMGESKNLSSSQRYKYNVKEFDRMHGLDWYDYGSRFHDPAIVRWFSVDKLAEKYRAISPYVYCANDPVNKFDPDGREVVDKLATKTAGQKITKSKFKTNVHDNINAIIIMVHGGNNGQSMSFINELTPDMSFKIVKGSDCYSLCNFLEDESQYWNTWKENKYIMLIPDIVIFSCGTGVENGIAQEQSKDSNLHDISVFAPSDDIIISPDGTATVDNNGVWREFINGEVVNEYPGNVTPGTENFSKKENNDTPNFYPTINNEK